MEKEIIVRDLRKKQQFVVDDEYLNGYAKICGIHATGVYLCLCRHADYHTQVAFPSIERMAEKLDISINSVKRGIQKLIDWNVIIKERVRNPKNAKWVNNSYTLLDKSQWKKNSHSPIGAMEPQPPVDENHSPLLPLKDSQVNDSHKEAKASFALLKVDKFFRNDQKDGTTPMSLQEFVLMCRGSQYAHIRIIGEYAEDEDSGIPKSTRGQWREFGLRNMRIARKLVPYNERQLREAMSKLQKDLKVNGGYMTKWTLETLAKYL